MSVRFSKSDIILAAVLVIAVLAVFILKTGNISVTKQIMKETKQVEFDVLLEEQKVSRVENLFKQGEKAFITVRNVPYTGLEIVNALKTPVSANSHVPHCFNFFVTLKDTAIITDDGPVVGGNKVKIGLPVTLEGYDYRLNGIITDVRYR